MSKTLAGVQPRLILFLGALLLAIGVSGVGVASASPPPVTLRGSVIDGGSPDSTGFSTASVNATLALKVASGTLETGGRTGGVDDFSHDEFSGRVTCMLVHGTRITVGAFGTAAFVEEVGATKKTTPLPGKYMQVAVFESVHIEEDGIGGPFIVRHVFGSLGTHHEGISSTAAPNCPKFSSQETATRATQDSLFLSPSITHPLSGFVSPSSKVHFAGTGEPDSSIDVFEVGHKGQATQVAVNAKGKWSLTLSGLSAGSHEYTAIAVGGSNVPANTVQFSVP